MVAVHDVLGCHALGLGLDGNGYAVLVAAADEEDVAAVEAQIACVDVGGDVNAGEVADVYGTVGVGKRRGDEGAFEVLGHIVV